MNGRRNGTNLLKAFSIVVVATLLAAETRAQDQADSRLRNWPQWRGPLATGYAPQADPPIRWDETTNVLWKTKLPGPGSSTPIIWEDRVIVLAAVRTDRLAEPPPEPHPTAKTRPPTHIYRFVVVCLNRKDGRIRWETTVREEVPHEGKHPTNTFASASPTTDGDHLYVSFGSRGVYCLDMQGKILWSRTLGRMRTRYGWGEAASPTLAGQSLIVTWDHEDQSSVVALNSSSGETRWKVERDEPTTWATPLVVDFEGRRQVIVNGTNRVWSYDLDDGEPIWQCGGQTVNAIPSPLRFQNRIICMSGYRGATAVAVRLDSRGDVTETDKVVWQRDRDTPYVPSPLLVGDRLYFTKTNRAILTCLDASSGEARFAAWRLPGLGDLYASPVAAKGRIYIVDRNGTTLVLDAKSPATSADGPKQPLQVLATNRLDDPIDASPALVGRQLFLRSQEYVYCIQAP